VNKPNTEGVCPLYKSCEKNHRDIVKLFIASKHIDINLKFREKFTPLMKAQEEGFADIVQLLTAAGAK
jgi:ankyrin repeat protein